MIRFEPLTPSQYDAYLAKLIPDYAAEHIRGGRWTAEEAPQAARKEIDNLLPEGPETSDHFFRTIVDGDSGASVGFIWYWLDRKRQRLFIYDIMIDEAYRRQGYARQALQKLEEEGRRLGAERIGLHVFGHNVAARALYEKMGYEITNIQMSKPL